MTKKIFLIVLALALALHVSAQKASINFKSKYQTAKQLLDQGKYGLAKQSFKSLLAKEDKNDLVVYAQFYLGNAAYYDNDKSYAKNVFLQITVKNKNWDKIEAVYLWLAQIGFEQSGVFKGMLYASKITSEPYLSKVNTLVKSQVQGQSIDALVQLHNEYPDSREIAKEYLNALTKLPHSDQSQMAINYLVEKFELDITQFNRIPPSVFKDTYEIGIMLPFFIDRVEATGKYLKKSLAVDIYEGAKMAAYDTDSTLFKLRVLDTKKDSAQLTVLLENGAFENLDAVLGPIYPKLVAKMEHIAITKKLNFVNPTSSNAKISDSSPYAFLLRASADQLAKKAANYMKTQDINKNVFIYYGSSKIDSISAFVYKHELEQDSFKIKAIIKIGSDNRREVYDGLTASKRIVDRRRTRKMTKEQIENAYNLPTINSMLIPKDSIGHIFIASSDPTISTEAMSAIISRGDSIKIMGVGNWFESTNAGLGIMEGLGVTLAISAVDDVATLEYIELTNRYINKYKSQPTKYFFRGYYAMKLIAESLKNYGTYFQNGYHQKGNFNPLFDYKSSNSNGAVKIIKLENNQIIALTPEPEKLN